jgi:hypothetical protein
MWNYVRIKRIIVEGLEVPHMLYAIFIPFIDQAKNNHL